MAFLDELSRTLSDKGKEAAQKAREAAGVLQMKAQIASEKSKLKELYGAVGVLYYKKHRDDEDNEFGDLFREIGNVLTNIDVLEGRVQEMEGAKVCPNCKKMMKKDALFCCYCGTALKTEEKEQEEDSKDAVAETLTADEDGESGAEGTEDSVSGENADEVTEAAVETEDKTEA